MTPPLMTPEDGVKACKELQRLDETVTQAPWVKGPFLIAGRENEVCSVRGLEVIGPRKTVPCGTEADFIVGLRNNASILLAMSLAGFASGWRIGPDGVAERPCEGCCRCSGCPHSDSICVNKCHGTGWLPIALPSAGEEKT